ncbi:MAG: HNH endonuclease [Dehalococcoidia bacterium]|nr:HNH endonuclease [Dehalococcoidia bacterium]
MPLVGKLSNISVGIWAAFVILFIILSCLNIIPAENASAQTGYWNWDVLSISGIKTNYQLGETISGNISFKINNPTDCPKCIQQILVGLVDSQDFVVDLKCIFDGIPQVCPQWTTGTGDFSWKNPNYPGTYRIIAVNDHQPSCFDAQLYLYPKITSYKNIATITVSASKTDEKSVTPTIPASPTSPPPAPPSQPDTGKKNGTVGVPDTTKPSGGIAPIALNKNTIIIISFVAALVILTLFASRKKGSKHFTKSILLLVLISFIGYLFWVYAIPPIADWFRHNLGTIIKVLLSLVALAIAGTAVWKKRDGIPILTKQNNKKPPIDIDNPRYIPAAVRKIVWHRDGGRCAAHNCGSRKQLEYDHILPVSKGGSNTEKNIRLLCKKCNRAKSDGFSI